MLKNMQFLNFMIWLLGGLFFSLIVYFAENDFQLTLDIELAYYSLVGGIFWGLLSGYLFGKAVHLKQYNFKKYTKVLRKRILKNRKLTHNIIEFDILKKVTTLEQVLTLWEIFILRIQSLDEKGISIIDDESWYKTVDQILKQTVADKKLSVPVFFTYIDIMKKFDVLDRKVLLSNNLIQLNQLLAKMTILLEREVVVKKEDLDPFEIQFLYYFYCLRLGIIELYEFQEYIDNETLKDDVEDVIIDIQFVSTKGVNEIIDVMYHYLLESRPDIRSFVFNIISRMLSYRIIQLYKTEQITLNRFFELMHVLYSFFPKHKELHVFYDWAYSREYGGYLKGIEVQEAYALNIADFV